MKEDTRKIELTPEGVFVVGLKHLSLSGLKSRKTRLEGEILRLHRRQRSLETQIKNNSKTIINLERELATFNSLEISQWVLEEERKIALERERQRQEKILANQRAKVFLREYIGEETYTQLMKEGSVKFTGRDGRTYKITSKGILYRGSSRVCVIHPRNLPLPDFIVSVLTTVKERRL